MVEIKITQNRQREDKITEYIFDKSFCIDLKVALDLINKTLGCNVVREDEPRWLEAYYRVKEDNKDKLIIEVIEPFCG
ncbi:hypothetical protein KQI42_19980 [Tissierella sp. MSJ-40]|uniref:Uncharacterized protein n=1 Tax=Tissierella simiarum TaxID=2841534 RepID=A0ABS6EBX2_9FIRM|nr:hypothetical protein [Tissierella simiarum]MBU5440277.1 hypothetical protein [Tissierella simiarum]